MALDFPASPTNGQGYQGSTGTVWIYDSTSASWESQGPTLAPTSTKIVFKPESASFPTSNPAQYKTVAGTNFPVESLAFDATTEETCYFKFVAVNYGTGNITVTVRWYADTATSGGVTWGAAIAAITPNTDSQDIETKAFGTEATGDDTHLGTTGQRLHSIDVTVTSLDSIAADDYCVLKLARKVANANDTMTGDALVVEVVVSYT